MPKVSLNSKGFRALLVTQFLGAFNDNIYKLVIAFLAVNLFVTEKAGTQFLALVGGIFVLPFIIFSPYAGYLADRFSKRRILISAKLAEMIIMTLGLVAFALNNIWVIFLCLFFMGTQSAFFGPSKYGILPEMLKDEDLSEGNGLLQMWTFLAIICGMSLGGILYQFSGGKLYKVSVLLVLLSIAGFISSLYIPQVKPSGAKRKFSLREISGTIDILKKDRAIYLAVLGVVYFGFLASLFHLNILLYAKKIMLVSEATSGMLFTAVALGIGVGSVLAGKLSGKKIEFGLVPLGAIILTLCSVRLGFTYRSAIQTGLTLFLLGFGAGFYVIPLNAFIQQRAPKERKGQVFGTLNIFSFAGILSASLVIWFLRDVFALNAAAIFVVLGIVSLAVTGYICSLLPKNLTRLILWLLTHTIYRIKAVDRDNVPREGGALLVANHVTLVDGFILAASLQRPVRFLIKRQVYNAKRFNWFFRLLSVIPISLADKPKELVRSLEMARKALLDGELVCVFPEGRITKTASLNTFREGFKHIVKGTRVPVIPVYMDRLWGSIFSFEGGKYYWKMPKRLPYPVTVKFGKPLAPEPRAFEARQRVSELGADAFEFRLKDLYPLPVEFFHEARKTPTYFCLADSSGRKLNYFKTLLGSVSLSAALKKQLKNEEMIGVLLPPSIAGAVVNLAISVLFKVPVNLNYTTSSEVINSCIRQCKIKYVITSKRFLDKLDLSLDGNIVFVEDLISGISVFSKLVSFVKCSFPLTIISRWLIFGRKLPAMDDLATVIFTSGSTGNPKGVMLTHSNIILNIQGLYEVFRVERQDRLLGILPFFHSFGFTGTLWFCLLSGVGGVYHFNPLDARKVGALVKKHKVTILIATPTFLQMYIRQCSSDDFASLTRVVVGAEKLDEVTAKAFEEKFGILPFEGYGCTECSPIVSVNVQDRWRPKGDRATDYQVGQKVGTIGRPIPGVAVRTVDPETLAPLGPSEEGLLLVKGANVMKGYLNMPSETQDVIKDGWYITGDIAKVDRDGFVTVTDRLARFSKIGGEMVPHIRVEEAIHKALGVTERVCVVSSVKDEKKGEKLVVLYVGDLNVDEIWAKLKKMDLPKLWIPSRGAFHKIESIPLLGSGKVNLKEIKEMVKEFK